MTTAYAYTDSTLVKQELGASVAFNNTTSPSITQVTTWITEESAHINLIGGRTFGSTDYNEVIDYSGEDLIQTENAPIISVNSLLYSTSELGSSGYALADTKTEGTHYTVYNDSGEIAVIWNNWSPSVGRKRMQVNYTAGYSTVPYTVQKLATKMVAKRAIDQIIENGANEGNIGGSISVGSISIVEPANLGLNSYRELTKDIDSLKKELVSGFGVYRYKLRY